MQPFTQETIVERRQGSLRWGAVLAGTAVAVGIWLVLQMLGMGIGLSAIDTDDAGSLRGVGIGTTVWSLIAPVLALFVGGIVAGRLSQSYDKKHRGTHGLVVWALTATLGTLALVSVVNQLASTAVRAGGAAMSGAGGAMATMAGPLHEADLDALGIKADDLIAPLNERLRAQGKPAVTADQVKEASKAALRSSVRRGSFDRATFVEELAAKTQLSRAEAEDVARQVEERFHRVRRGVHRMGERATGYALEAAEKTGKAMLAASVSMLVGLLAAVIGALIAWRRRDRGERVVQTTVPPPTTPTPPAVTPSA